MHRKGMAEDAARRESERIYALLTPYFSHKAIVRYGLTNPYMSRDARQVMINEALRDGNAKSLKRPKKLEL